MQPDEILNQYRRLRAISTRLHNAALDCVARPAIMERAKHLGLARGQTWIIEDDAVMPLVFDLALHTAKPGRSRAVDRYARAAALSPDGEEARTMDAIRSARFSIWRIERRHEVAGMVIADILRDREAWFIDEAMTSSTQPGFVFASRLCWPAAFAMTCGIIVPIEAELLGEAAFTGGGWMEHADPALLADDPRFATAIYRAAVNGGMMQRVGFREVALAS